ncbi:MAG: CRISPR-associated protein Cas7 [Bacteroidetes bacterium]|nr:CRISPR-associated protein Cas7 [Bacteroidota bacterium]
MNTIYIRTLKRVNHSVFSVEKGQKIYWDSQFKKGPLPYSSGQQIKRSILDKLNSVLNIVPSPTTFVSKVAFKKETLEFDGEGEVYGTCNPVHADQLLGGWMKAVSGSRVLKRRSPLSISAMTALHPLLAGVNEENLTFDRKDRSNTKVIVKIKAGNDYRELSEEEIIEFLENREKHTSLASKYIQDQRRANGLFIQDIAIDLRRLFCVSLNKLEPEITEETENLLCENGWEESENVFGRCLVAPKATREKLIPALANSIINWAITSNQSRTFSLMETLAVSISDNANKIAGSIRAKLSGEEENKAVPIIEEDLNGVDTFVTLPAAGYIITKKESADALDKAEQKLIDLMMAFDYENQL